MQQAKSLNPAFAMNYLGHAMIHCLSGTLDEVEPNIDVALRLSPHDPLKTFMLSHVSLARLLGHQFEDALDWADRAINENANNWMAHQYRAAALGLMGGTSRAQGALSMATALRPALSAQYVRDAFAFKYPEHAKLLIEGLSQAGMTAWLRRVGDPGRRRGRDERTGDLGHPAADQTRAGEQHSC